MADKITSSLAEAKILVMKGQAGFSPQIEIKVIDGGHQIRITTKISDTQYRTDVFNIMDGAPGEPGIQGEPGTPGAPGVSPTVSVQDIAESLPGGGTKIIGHTVTITDAAGDHSFNVMNGADGANYVLTNRDRQEIAEMVNAAFPRIAMTAQDIAPTLEANKLYVFPEMDSLDITFAAPTDSSIVNEYHFVFTSGATATTLALPATIHQPDGFSVEANMVYEVSIMENCMTAQGWAVSAS